MAKDDGNKLDDKVFRRLIELGSDLVVLVDCNFQLLYVSPAVEELSGRKSTNPRDRALSDFIDSTDLDRHRTSTAALKASPGERIRFDSRFRHADGSWRYIEACVQNLLHDPTVAAIAVNIRDISDRKAAEQALAESESRFRLFADNALDIVARYRLQPTPGLEYISPSVERITGYAPADHYADANLSYKIIHPEDRESFEEFTRNFFELAGTPIRFRWIHKEGHTIWIEQLNVLVRDDDDKVVATESISRDVTEQVTLERKLLQSQKIEAVGRLAGGIAHDFNNILTVVASQASLLKRKLPGNEHAESSARVILETAERAAALTRQLLAFSRREVVRAQHVRLSEAVTTIEEMLRHLIPSRLTFETKLDSQSAILIDPSQLEQILVNLVVNAKEAIDAEGHIFIKTEDSDDARVCLRVSDTGAGIDSDTLSKIFEPFFSTKHTSGGSGLGLSVVHGIVVQSKGEIVVTSSPGEDTEFTISWPASTQPSASEQSETSSSEANKDQARPAHILLAEDEPLLRKAFAEILRSQDYEVLEADDGKEALALYEKLSRKIDLLITDMVMPRLGGRALAEKLVQNQPTLEVLYISGHSANEDDRKEAARAGRAFLAKPFDGEMLLARVRELLAIRN